jgi:membrane peptidoglycan carboxypeptidase
MEREVAQSTTIYDRTGEHILYEIHGNEKRTMINLEELPRSCQRWRQLQLRIKIFITIVV